jgi:CRP-like cAMP-binding protein
MISNDLINMQEQLVRMAFSTVRQRLAKVLLDLDANRKLNNSDYKGIDIFREDLAGLIGTATETAIRMLTEFKDEGIVTIVERRRIIVEKKSYLEEIVLFG